MTKSVEIGSWVELAERLEEYREQGWLFRGEAKADYGPLRPKAGRSANQPGWRRQPYTKQDERRVLDDFRQLARPHLSFHPVSGLEWLSIAQHHGLPTRLLDWTTNLFVAAYFAVEVATEPGVIYCVRDVEEAPDDAGADPFVWESVKVHRPAALSPRVFAQQSVFTVHHRPHEVFTHPGLERWLIGAGACWEIKRNLSAAGVNAASLFPGLDGLAQHLGWMYKWSYFDSSTQTERSRRKR